MEKDYTVLSVYLPDDIKQKIVNEADKNCRSLSQQVVFLIKESLGADDDTLPTIQK